MTKPSSSEPPPPSGMKPITELKARAIDVLNNQSRSYYVDAVDFAVVVLQYTALVDDLIDVQQRFVAAKVDLRTITVSIEAIASTPPGEEREELIVELRRLIRRMQ